VSKSPAPPYYNVWGLAASEPRPSLYAEAVTRSEAIAEAEGMWHGGTDLRSVWVQVGDVVVWAAGEKAEEGLTA